MNLSSCPCLFLLFLFAPLLLFLPFSFPSLSPLPVLSFSIFFLPFHCFLPCPFLLALVSLSLTPPFLFLFLGLDKLIFFYFEDCDKYLKYKILRRGRRTMPSLYSAIKHGTGGSRMRLMLVPHLVFIHAMSDSLPNALVQGYKSCRVYFWLVGCGPNFCPT